MVLSKYIFTGLISAALQKPLFVGRVLSAMETGQNDGRLSTIFRPLHSQKVSCPDYDKAVMALNGMQTFISLPKSGHKQSSEITNLMSQWLECLGYSLSDLDRLNAVHVSGTKGKGSTCAFTESMLRHGGHKTGLFTSPHLRQARERIKLNGVPLSPEMFAKYFNSVHGRLKENSKLPLPGYFHFLTLLAFDVFLKEGVDVAVIEVGIGGEYDATNVIRRPAVCGVSALGMDHISILGDTVAKIAWHKAGIFKTGVPAFTQPQPEEAMRVLVERAANAECRLAIVPPYETYFSETIISKDNTFLQLGLDGEIQRANASLALQLFNAWGQSNTISEFKAQDMMATAFRPNESMLTGLRECRWPGRFQRVKRGPFTFWVDGAHTPESITLCAEWFFNACKLSDTDNQPSVLLFNTTGPRNFDEFLTVLVSSARRFHGGRVFDMALFSPTVAYLPPAVDSAYNVTMHGEQVARCREMAKFWIAATETASSAGEVATTVEEAVIKIEERFPRGCHVLVTGSLHLVGALLEALDEPVV